MSNNDTTVPHALASEVAQRRNEDVLAQSITWKPESWKQDTLQDHRRTVDDLENLTKGSITRRHVVETIRDDAVRGFVATMIWGFGTTGYGAYRTGQIVDYAGDQLRPALEALYIAAATTPTAARKALVKTNRLKYFGPAFGTKFLYFAALAQQDDDTGEIPLISDVNTAKAMWHLTDHRVKNTLTTAKGYDEYVDLAHRWAREMDVTADQVERALFDLGKEPTTREYWPHGD